MVSPLEWALALRVDVHAHAVRVLPPSTALRQPHGKTGKSGDQGLGNR